jgi:hypothetical protein
MARNHTEWRDGKALCGQAVKPFDRKAFTCTHCQAISGVIRSATTGLDAAGLTGQVFPAGNNAARVECDTATPEFRRFVQVMRRGTELPHRYSVRGITGYSAVVRIMAA